MKVAKEKARLAILRGTLDVLVLRSVSARPRHGFDISLWIEEHSNGTLDLDDSALYQALHRLEARRLLQGAWATSENNRRARYYKLTPSGRVFLAGASAKLLSYATTITSLLGPTKGK